MYDSNNIFARILRAELPCTKIYEDSYMLAIEDIAPLAPLHILVIPKGEYISFADFVAKVGAQEVGHFFKKIGEIAASQSLCTNGYRLVTNHGQDAGQLVPHFHVHILAGKKLGGKILAD